jgi:hypothetical protein
VRIVYGLAGNDSQPIVSGDIVKDPFSSQLSLYFGSDVSNFKRDLFDDPIESAPLNEGGVVTDALAADERVAYFFEPM